MFSSSFSLRQNIKAVDTELGDYKVSNNARVDVLETFKANLEGDAAGSIADLETKHNEQAALIATLETNATALKSRIDTFNAALEDGSDGTISTIEQIKLNKDGLTQELLDRASEDVRIEGLVSTLFFDATTLTSTETLRATAAEATLQANINAEVSDRQSAIVTEITERTAAFNSALDFVSNEETRALTAETALQNNITAEATNRAAAVSLEVVNRNNAIAVEAAARAAAITAEQTTRETAIEKVGFMPFCEAEGILIDNSYPFCLGMGSPSDVGFGMPIPFAYTLRGIAWSIHSSDTNPSIDIEVTHYPSDGSASRVIFYGGDPLVGKSGEFTSSVMLAGSPGNLVVKLLSSSGITDDDTRYRLSFVLTFDDSIYYSKSK